MKKLNNYHFGRHVFEYFPWYKYNDNINSDVKLVQEVYEDFKFAFSDKFSSAQFIWYEDTVSISKLSRIFSESGSMIYKNGSVIEYKGIKETVKTWEDIEKIRLRCILGIEEDAIEYMKIIDFYNKYKYLIIDALYLDSGSEEIKTPLINISDIVNREYEDLCCEFITENDVYESINLRKYKSNKFTDSVSSFYKNRGYLTERQISAFKKFSYKEILSNKDRFFFSIKMNKIKNIDRMIKYFESIELSCKKTNNDLLLTY